MRTKNPNILGASIVCLFIVLPLIASASWWNPFSWFSGWFGTSKTSQTTEVSPSQAGFLDQDNAFYSRAGSKKMELPAPIVPQPSAPGGSVNPTNPTNPTPSARPTTPPTSSGSSMPPDGYFPPGFENPVNQGQISQPGVSPSGAIAFSDSVRIHRRTSGTATSGNTIYVRLTSTSSYISIDQRSDNGMYFYADQCRTNPCAIKNVVTVPSSVPEGTYTVAVTVTSGTSSAIGRYSVIVLPPEPLTINMTRSANISLKKNANGSVSGSNSIIIQLLTGTPEPLALTHSKFPDGVTGNINLGTCSYPPCTMYNSITVSPTAAEGQHSMTIHAKGASIDQSVSYTLFVGSSDTFGMSFKGEERTYTQNENPTAKIVMDYPFDLLLTGGSPETATLSLSYPQASTSVQFSQSTCRLPCMGQNAHIEFLPGMKQGYYNVTLSATVDRQEEAYGGGMRTVRYNKTWNIPVQIVPLSLP